MSKLKIKRVTQGIDHVYTVCKGANVLRIITDGRRAVVTEYAGDSFIESYKCSAESAAASLHSFTELSLHHR